MRFSSLALLSVLVLSLPGCVMIPYESPEARAKIESDLSVAPADIIGITETNWCPYTYGIAEICHPTQGLGVLTKDGFILSLYQDKTYTRVRTLRVDEVVCAKVTDGRGKPETFYVFTKNDAFMLAPITPGGSINIPMKDKIFDYLVGNQQKVFTGIEGSFVKLTGNRVLRYVTTPGFKPGMAKVNEFAIVNPCPGAEQPEPTAQK
jgi:hypothetical protein